MIHDVGSGVVNALCVIESIKVVGICKIDKKEKQNTMVKCEKITKIYTFLIRNSQ